MGKSKNKLINKLYFRSPVIFKNLIASYYGYKQRKKRYGKEFFDYFQLLRNTEYYSTNELEKIQLGKLKEFLLFAYEHSAYYKNQFDKHKFNPKNFNQPEKLRQLPILSKEDVRKHTSSISCAKHFSKLHISKTSGTSGKPLIIPNTNDCFQKEYANQELLFSWYDLNNKSKSAKVAGQQVAHIDKNKPPFWVYDNINNGLYMSSYHLSDIFLPYYIKELEKFQPEILEGYPSSLYLLALANKKLGGLIKPKLVRTGSETLLDFQRKAIEESFQCKAHNIYGCGENCVSGLECENGKIHLQMLFSYIELINKEGNPAKLGETARVVATGFSNYAFPLIRYEIGDTVELSENQECACGRGGMLINSIYGRVEDSIITSDGRIIGRLGHVFKNAKGVVNAQIIQNSKSELVLNVVKDANYTTDVEKTILRDAYERIGGNMNIIVKYPKAIEKDKNGKFRFVISKLPKKDFYTNT